MDAALEVIEKEAQVLTQLSELGVDDKQKMNQDLD